MIPNREDFESYWKCHTKVETATQFGVSKYMVEKLVCEFDLFKRREISVDLTEKQLELITGSMLGDGCLSKLANDKSNFVECHSIAQEDYLKWKSDILMPFSRNIVYQECNTAFPGGKHRKVPSKICQIYTVRHNCFAALEKQWYLRDCEGNYVIYNKKRVKKLPDNLVLNPFIIAVWFFDDGWRSRNYAHISTNAFSYEECYRLVDLIKELGIKTKVTKTKYDNQYEIYIPTTSYVNFINMISEYVPCESLKYKVDLSEYVITKNKVLPRLEECQVEKIFRLAKTGATTKEIAKEVKSTRQNISDILRGKTWKNVHKRMRRRNENAVVELI